MFNSCCKIILASASPRRQMFLQELGLDYTIVCPDDTVEPLASKNENPTNYAMRAAQSKAWHVHNVLQGKEQEYLVLAADTVVCVQDKILGKPKDAAHALGMLKLLSGQEHEVISAVSLVWQGRNLDPKHICFFDSTRVFFHAWNDQVLATYVSSGEGIDKAGAYAIQGQGAFLVKSIQGSWSTVVGLPVGMLVDVLLTHGFIKIGTE